MWVVQWCLNITKMKRKAVVSPQKGKEQKEGIRGKKVKMKKHAEKCPY